MIRSPLTAEASAVSTTEILSSAVEATRGSSASPDCRRVDAAAIVTANACVIVKVMAAVSSKEEERIAKSIRIFVVVKVGIG